MRHRTWNRLRAYLGGYFWLPCPNCGTMFGGHERGGGILYTEPDARGFGGVGFVLCPLCPDDRYSDDPC